MILDRPRSLSSNVEDRRAWAPWQNIPQSAVFDPQPLGEQEYGWGVFGPPSLDTTYPPTPRQLEGRATTHVGREWPAPLGRDFEYPWTYMRPGYGAMDNTLFPLTAGGMANLLPYINPWASYLQSPQGAAAMAAMTPEYDTGGE